MPRTFNNFQEWQKVYQPPKGKDAYDFVSSIDDAKELGRKYANEIIDNILENQASLAVSEHARG